MTKLLVVSFDAVGDDELARLFERPNFAKLAANSALRRKASSIFPTNTYPVHACIATGRLPRDHGLISNVDPFPARHQPWHAEEARLKTQTLWRAAAARGMKTAAVMWPVTAGAKTIRYNIPEVLPKPGKSQIFASLGAGSKLLQLREFLRHKSRLRGIAQPERDDFTAHCMADILREKKPELALMHLTAFDSLCHEYGKGSPELEQALDSLDANLGLLLSSVGDDCAVIVFSDHSQLNVHSVLTPNDWLAERGLLQKTGGEYAPSQSGCYIECCGGCAFFVPGSLGAQEIERLKRALEQSEGFGRFLRADEMDTSGHAALPFGFSAAPGYCYNAYPAREKANHGYPVDTPGYEVFFMVKAPGFAPGGVSEGGCILEITGIAAGLLGLELETENP